MNKKFVATVIKDLFKIYFNEMEKLLLMEGLMEMLEENGVQYPENQLPLARMKDLLKNKSLLG